MLPSLLVRCTSRRARCAAIAVAVAAIVVSAGAPADAGVLPYPGWSGAATAAVADFDADGLPDVVLAEHVDVHAGAEYELRIRLATGSAETIVPVRSSRAIAVVAVDIDHDHDLDLVVTPLLDRHVTAVWLNDGAGHFSPKPRDSRAATDDVANELAPPAGFTSRPGPGLATATASQSRRLGVADAADGRDSHPLPAGIIAAVANDAGLSPALTADPPRGPPTSSRPVSL